MTPTEITLTAVHRSNVVRLDIICKDYFGMTPKTAYDRAATNQLPVPTFRLSDSRKAPLMVRVSDLAKHIDTTAEAANELWEASQV